MESSIAGRGWGGESRPRARIGSGETCPHCSQSRQKGGRGNAAAERWTSIWLPGGPLSESRVADRAVVCFCPALCVGGWMRHQPASTPALSTAHGILPMLLLLHVWHTRSRSQGVHCPGHAAWLAGHVVCANMGGHGLAAFSIGAAAWVVGLATGSETSRRPHPLPQPHPPAPARP